MNRNVANGLRAVWAVLLACGLSGGCTPDSEPGGEVAVIPQPTVVERCDGSFRLRPSTRIVLFGEGPTAAAVEPLQQEAERLFGRRLPVARTTRERQPRRGAVNMRLDTLLGAEAYRLRIAPDRVEIAAGAPAGLFHALQTVRQLLPAGISRTPEPHAVTLPALRIEDAPRFPYRGLMLDVARHFFTVEEVKRTIDLLAMHKMNVFHWHLTDDQGWRIEIKRYPELTRTGSVRRRTLIGKDPGGVYDETCRYDERPYGGYYTQEQIRDVVAYAASRFVTVIPEIEFPGHAVAALASYPWLGCTGEPCEVRQTWDIDDRVFCPGRETTFEFIEQVLDEVIGLFPAHYIHIGGDECPTSCWERCPHCRTRMRTEKLASPRQLQGYATARVERYLQRHGRRLIGWDEILDGGVSATAVVMSWRGTEGGIRAAKQGNHVVMAPTSHCYLDYYQTADTASEPLAWGGYLPLDQVWAFDPLAGLSDDETHFVLGVQANLWTEYIPDFAQAQYMLLPRLAALAEVAWGRQPGSGYADFRSRLSRLAKQYDACGYRYAPHGIRQEE